MGVKENLKRIMDERGISQTELAEMIGTSQQTISKIITGATEASRKLPKIARALGVPVTDLDPLYPIRDPALEERLERIYEKAAKLPASGAQALEAHADTLIQLYRQVPDQEPDQVD